MKETIFLYSRSGNVQVYANKDEAYKALGFSFIVYSVSVHIGEIGKYATEMSFHPKGEKLAKMNQYTTQKKFGDFVLRNEYDDVLTIADFDVQVNNNKATPFVRHDYKFWNGEGAIPGTGKRKRYGRWLRSPKTTAAIRSSLSVVKEDGEPEFRGARRRGYCTLPTRWDDIYKESYQDRNWKGFRKQQWKEKR